MISPRQPASRTPEGERLVQAAGGAGHPAGHQHVQADVAAGGQVRHERGQRLRAGGGQHVVVVDEQHDPRQRPAGRGPAGRRTAVASVAAALGQLPGHRRGQPLGQHAVVGVAAQVVAPGRRRRARGAGRTPRTPARPARSGAPARRRPAAAGWSCRCPVSPSTSRCWSRPNSSSTAGAEVVLEPAQRHRTRRDGHAVEVGGRQHRGQHPHRRRQRAGPRAADQGGRLGQPGATAGSGSASRRGSATCAYSLPVVSARPGVSAGTAAGQLAVDAGLGGLGQAQLDPLGEGDLLGGRAPRSTAGRSPPRACRTGRRGPAGRAPRSPGSSNSAVELAVPVDRAAPPRRSPAPGAARGPAGAQVGQRCPGRAGRRPAPARPSIACTSSTVRRTRSRSSRPAIPPTCGSPASAAQPAAQQVDAVDPDPASGCAWRPGPRASVRSAVVLPEPGPPSTSRCPPPAARSTSQAPCHCRAGSSSSPSGTCSPPRLSGSPARRRTPVGGDVERRPPARSRVTAGGQRRQPDRVDRVRRRRCSWSTYRGHQGRADAPAGRPGRLRVGGAVRAARPNAQHRLDRRAGHRRQLGVDAVGQRARHVGRLELLVDRDVDLEVAVAGQRPAAGRRRGCRARCATPCPTGCAGRSGRTGRSPGRAACPARCAGWTAAGAPRSSGRSGPDRRNSSTNSGFAVSSSPNSSITTSRCGSGRHVRGRAPLRAAQPVVGDVGDPPGVGEHLLAAQHLAVEAGVHPLDQSPRRRTGW